MNPPDVRIPLLIDTDPGVDDALALLMAFASPGHEVLGLTVAAGNVGLAHTVANALKLCEVAGVRVPVFPGCPVPLLHPADGASHVHGRDGFGDIGYLPARSRPEDEHAALAIIRLSHQHHGRLVLVMLGPLTNLALALRLDPGLPDRLGRLVVMGGAVTGRGNITPWVEFNFGFDPEAAHIVFDTMPRLDLVDWEAVLAHAFARDEFEGWLARGDDRARFYHAISRRFRDAVLLKRGQLVHAADSLAMAAALDPGSALEWTPRHVHVALEPGPARGGSLVDWQCQGGQPANARILTRIDMTRFAALVRAGLGASTD